MSSLPRHQFQVKLISQFFWHLQKKAERERISQMPSSESPWNELDIPHGGEVSVSEINDYYWKKAMPHFVEAGRPWTDSNFREMMAKEYKVEHFLIRAPVQVVKGEEPIVGVTLDLKHALEILYDFPVTADLWHQTWFLDVCLADSDDVVQARLKSLIGVHARTPDHIIISRKLSEELGLGGEVGLGTKDIKILSFHADIGDLDLDKWG